MAEKNKTALEYPVKVFGRHVDVTDAMKSYALEKLSKIDKLGGRVIEAAIILDVQKMDHVAEYILNINNTNVYVAGHSPNMYASIDEAIDRLQGKLTRYLRRLHEHHAKSAREVDMKVNVIQAPADSLVDINDQIEEENLKRVEQLLAPHKAVSQETMKLKTLNLDEAIMKMELSADSFLIYHSEEDNHVKVIYRRKDNNYGVVDVESSPS